MIMKELSIEQKAKAYDEAISMAKKFYTPDSNNVNLKATLEMIFPELKESEDERIRKAIIDYFRWNPDGQLLNEFSNREVLAWLEKQGEHAKFWDSIQVGDKVTRNQDGVLVNLSRLKRVAKRDEKQGEQKPAEWSEEDEVAINMAIIALEDMYSENEPETTYAGFSLPFDKAASRLKSLRPQSHWKPSDEQIESLSHMIDAVESEWACKETIGRELLKQLKELRGE